MSCNEVGGLVAPHVDGETDDLKSHAIEKHLRGCVSCTETHIRLIALRERIVAEVTYFQAPPALRARIVALRGAALETTPRPPRVEVNRWAWLGGGVLAGCAATMLAWAVGSTVIAWQANEGVALEAVTTHVRATLNDRLIEVASSDQHTVKPWLSARLDYSPPVRDFADEGFALTGGRLDVLDRQRVATLVYRHRRHTIDVFVRPLGAHAPSTLRAVRGFNLAHATGGGMDWLAVSDVGVEVLAPFVERLAREAASP